MKRPWNLPDQPVYSLATTNGIHVNMNICTYVVPVSMNPKLYAIAVYHGTRTLENLQSGSSAVLQLLSSDQYGLVKYLGKRSGRNSDKEKYLRGKGHLTTWKDRVVLKDACAWLSLDVLNVQPTGDHELYIFRVTEYRTLRDDVLTTGELNRRGIISV